MSTQDWLNKDFYATLGVPKDADAAAIKKAYRKLARDLHPDRKPDDPKAEQRFKEVGEAYSVLSDAEQRRQYDAVRTMGAGGARFTAGGSGGAGGFEDVMGGMFGGGAGGAGGFEDIMSQMFGGGFQRGPQRGRDLAAATEVTFRQAAEGAKVSLRLQGGTVQTRLPAGVRDKQRIRVPGKGQPGASGGPPGDLLLTVHVAKHPVFTLDGTNLRLTLPVSVDEAAMGATVEVPTLDGKRVKVKVPAGTSSGTTLRVKGKGIVTPKGAGDLLATVDISVPSALSKAAKEALSLFAKETAGHNPRESLYKDAAR